MKTFKEYYKLPLKNTTYSHVFDAKSNMVMEIPNDELRDKIVRLINGEDIKDLSIPSLVAYASTKIFNGNGDEIISIRGWGRLSKLPDGAKVQDAIGWEIANLINSVFNQT